jgi:hypothetical protein
MLLETFFHLLAYADVVTTLEIPNDVDAVIHEARTAQAVSAYRVFTFLFSAMNPIPMLCELLAAQPFKPFMLCLSDERQLPVPHREFLTVSPHGNAQPSAQQAKFTHQIERMGSRDPFAYRYLRIAPRSAA